MDELKDMAECGLCGTAAVISPVGKIVDHGREICLPSGMDEMGPVTKKLYDTLTGIQMGHSRALRRLDLRNRVIIMKSFRQNDFPYKQQKIQAALYVRVLDFLSYVLSRQILSNSFSAQKTIFTCHIL